MRTEEAGPQPPTPTEVAAPPGDPPPPLAGSIQAPRPDAEPLPGAPPTVQTPGRPRVRASPTEGFGLDSADGRFSLSLGILAQLRFALDEEDGDVDPRFSILKARIMVQGHLWGDRVQYQLQPEFADGVRLLDANATIEVHPAFAILAGQYRPWFSRGFPTNLPLQALLERGPVLEAFRYDRDVGVTLMGRPFAGRMEYYVGVLNGEGLDRQLPRNPQPLVTARLVGAPLGALAYSQTTAIEAADDLPFRLAFAANAATNEISPVAITTDPVTGDQSTTILPDRRTVVVSGDVALQGWRMMAMAEGFWRWNREDGGPSDQAWGAYGLVSGVLVRQRLDLVLRIGALRQENDPEAHLPVEPGFGVYVLGNHIKVQARYRCDVGSGDGSCRSHGADLQGQLWF